ncbi:cyclodeaminase/cyclohydrolase family protein [Paenibacillus sp. J2TS4]|uniref:cyclodeaminase/cyclohydrolase family protein n=1 Tax=Paenibacillus sp. J2TS4 TaxID=2807194 RepID=UPI001B22CA8C|nr:cyclodeaminase/cyclohydrolase family protein [Paenibacillus sp. J2TS4]GIP35269.1 sugar ABC transporter substrate-binding protein [Paenibacillus sp. J2TS4]
MSSIMNLSVRSFIQEASSRTPTPGGGSVAALVAALGASMASMVAHFSQGPKYASIQEEMDGIVTRMKADMDQFEALLEEDIRSFETYMAASRMPAQTEELKQAKDIALASASVLATEVPVRLLRRCLASLETIEDISARVNRNVLSDLGIAVHLLEAAARSAMITVTINLSGLKDDSLRDKYERECERAIIRIEAIRAQMLAVIDSRINELE